MPPPANAKSEVVSIDAYVRQALISNARRNARRNAERTSPIDPLTVIVRDWFDSLPIVTRHRKYQLVEISDALLTRTGHRFADRNIAAVLESMGWTSGRSWTRAGRNRRYHTPPATQL